MCRVVREKLCLEKWQINSAICDVPCTRRAGFWLIFVNKGKKIATSEKAETISDSVTKPTIIYCNTTREGLCLVADTYEPI